MKAILCLTLITISVSLKPQDIFRPLFPGNEDIGDALKNVLW